MSESNERPAGDPPESTPPVSENHAREEPRGHGAGGDACSATGVAGLVALAQSLEEPWRTIASIAGPLTVVVGRWLANRLETAFHLLEAGLILKATRWCTNDKTQIEDIEAEVQKLRLFLIDRIKKRIRRSGD